MEIKILNKIIDTIKSVNSDYCMKELMDMRILYRDDVIRMELIDIKLSNDSIDTKNTRIKSSICSHRFFKSRDQIPDNLFIYSLFPVLLFLTSCLKEFFVFSRLNEDSYIPDEIEALCTVEEYQKIKDEALSLIVPSYNSFVDEFWSNCSDVNDIGRVVTFYQNKLKDVIFNFNLRADAIKLMEENLSVFLEMGLISDSIYNTLSVTYEIMVDEKFDYFDKINYFLEEAQYSMNPEDNPNYMGIRENIKNTISINTKAKEEVTEKISITTIEIKEKEIRKLFSKKLNIIERGISVTPGDRLISDLKIMRPHLKDYARLAMVLYDSREIRTPGSFNKWLFEFYNLLNIEDKRQSTYKKKDAPDYVKLKSNYPYLF